MSPEEEADGEMAWDLDGESDALDDEELTMDTSKDEIIPLALLEEFIDDAALARALYIELNRSTDSEDTDYDLTEWEDDDLTDDGLSSPLTFLAQQGRTRQPTPHTILLEASRTRDSNVEQLCKADGAFYSRDTVNAGVDGSSIPLSEFTAHVRNAKCTMCNQNYFTSPADIFALFKDWDEANIACLSSEITCPRCNMVTCLFCASRMLKKSSWVRIHGKKVSWCCTSGRLFLLWITLCAFDERYYPVAKPPAAPQKLENESAVKSTFDEIRKVKKREAESMNPRKKGVGFEGPSTRYLQAPPSEGFPGHKAENDDGLSPAQKVQIEDDTFGSMALRLLASLLPGLSRVTNFDYEPPGVVSTMLLDSKIFDYSAALLRNDSLDDVLVRELVYQGLLTFVTSLCDHHATSRLIYKDRLVRSDSSNLLSLSFTEASSKAMDKRESLFDSVRNLAMQSGLLVQRAHEKDFSTQDGQRLMGLARRINELWNWLRARNPDHNVISRSKDGDALNADPDPIADQPDDLIMASHYYTRKAKEIEDAPRGRMRKILTDITILRTGLPRGICVRYGSDRPDVMKAIIRDRLIN